MALFATVGIGCGGTIFHGHLYHAPSLPEEQARVVAESYWRVLPRHISTVRVVGIRGLGDNFVVVDVLILNLYPESRHIPANIWFRYVFNGFACPATEGVGFALRTCESEPIRQIPIDASSPPSAEFSARYQLTAEFEGPIISLPDGDTAQVVPVMVAYERPIEVGSCVQIHIDPVQSSLSIGQPTSEPLITRVMPLQ